MAEIDASIPLQVKPIQFKTPFELQTQMNAMQQGQNQNRLAQMQFAEADRANTERNQLRDIYKQSADASGAIDQNKLYSSLASGNRGDLIPGIQKTYNEANSSGVKLQNEKLEGVKRQAEITNAQAMKVVQRLSAHINDPNLSKESILADIQSSVKSGESTPEQVKPMIDRISQLPEGREPLAGFLTLARNKFLTPEQQANAEYRANNDQANRDVTIGGQDKTDARAREFNATNMAAKASKPMPTAALKMQQEELDAIGTASSINADLGTIETQIKDKKLNLGPTDNLMSKIRNNTGLSDVSSRNFASFQATLEKLRNDSLRLNKGVQTDGDAQRAWNELMANINDPNVVTQRLGEIKLINERAATIRGMNIEQIRSNFGAEPLDTSRYSNQRSALGGQPREQAPAVRPATGNTQSGATNLDSLLDKYK